MRVRLCEQGRDRCEQTGDCKRGAPGRTLCEDIQADFACAVDVAMVYASAKAYSRRFERILCWKLDGQEKYT